MVIVDTSAWIEFFRRDGDPHVKLAVKGLLDAYECALRAGGDGIPRRHRRE
jgi:hypothetical protein